MLALMALDAAVRPLQVLLACALTLLAASFVVGHQMGDPAHLVAPERIVALRVLDREGELLREPLGGQGDRGRWVALRDVSPFLVSAVTSAEDRRFAAHRGVDPAAVARAAAQNASAGRVVSGGSTITQQLVKLSTGRTRQRTLGVKLQEMAAALHYERHLDKDRIMEAYLNWIPFGHLARGVEMASQTYFAKPAAHLSVSESAALAALIRGPGGLDPYRHPDELEKRRRWVLERMLKNGHIDTDQYRHGVDHPPRFRKPAPVFEAPHLAEEILQRTSEDRFSSGAVVTTIDSRLQQQAESLVESIVQELSTVDVSTASVVVIHNPTGEVVAWVGSRGYFHRASLGMNDGVTARRSPGSALKPILYAEAMEHGYTPATMLADVPTSFPTPEGAYRPSNYDDSFRGPVLLREALGSSLNVPAVAVAAHLGPATVLDAMHRAGLESLDRDASHYGAAIALGDGEVTLLELASAYSALARGGRWMDPVLVRELRAADGSAIDLEPPATRRVFHQRTAYLVTDILSDPTARAPAFGRAAVFDLGFPVAVKTGTSHDYRDNWTVGYTPVYTVAAWVGNFDGTPMGNISGITGAGPLFASVMQSAMEGLPPHDFPRPPGLVERRVCALSGGLPSPHCHVVRTELFARGTEPQEKCSIHQVLPVDTRNGLLASAGCAADVVQDRPFEVYPEQMAHWAVKAGRPVAPGPSDLCSDAASVAASASPGDPPSILEPSDGAVFSLVPDIPASQQVVKVKLDPGPSQRVTLMVDGEKAGEVTGAPWVLEWALEPGKHLLTASSGSVAGAPVSVYVN